MDVLGTYGFDLLGQKLRDAPGDFLRLHEDDVDETGDSAEASITVIHGYGSRGEDGRE